MEFTARKAGLQDLESLTSFTLEEALEAEGRELHAGTVREGIKECLQDPSIAQYWVLVSSEQEPAGCVSLIRERSDWLAGYYGWIQSMYLSPELRGMDLMRVLLDAVLEQAKRERLNDLRLYVHQDNTPAIKAYLKNGFKPAPYRILVAGIR